MISDADANAAALSLLEVVRFQKKLSLEVIAAFGALNHLYHSWDSNQARNHESKFQKNQVTSTLSLALHNTERGRTEERKCLPSLSVG